MNDTRPSVCHPFDKMEAHLDEASEGFPKECFPVSIVSERTQSDSDLDSDIHHEQDSESKTVHSECTDSNPVTVCDSETEWQENAGVASSTDNSHGEFELEEITDLMSCLKQALPQYLGDEAYTTELSGTQDHSGDVVITQDHGADVMGTQDHGGDVMGTQDFSGDVVTTQDHGADVMGTQDHGGDAMANQDHGADVVTIQDHGANVLETQDKSADVVTTQDQSADVVITQDQSADVVTTEDCITDVPETPECTIAEADSSLTRHTSDSDSHLPHFPDSESVDLAHVLIDVILGSEALRGSRRPSVSSASHAATFPEDTDAATTVERDSDGETKSADTESSDEEEKLEQGSAEERAAQQEKDKEQRTEDEGNDDEQKGAQLPSDAEAEDKEAVPSESDDSDDEDSSSDEDSDLLTMGRLLAMIDDDWLPDLEDIHDDNVLAQLREYFNECPVCLEQKRLDTRTCCQFKVCRSCFQKYLTSKVSEGIVSNIQCPNSECHAKLNEYEISTRLTHSMKAKYIKYLTDAKNDPTEKTCPRCGQEEKVDKKLLKQKTTLKKGLRVSCPNCDLEWCFRCHAPWHDGVTCKEYRKGDQEFRDWVQKTHERQANAQKCPKCKIYIQRSSGCSHMTCNRCTTEFCYDCGKHYYPRGMHHRVANSRVFRYTLGTHSSKLSPMGCSRNFMPESNAARRLIRGSLLGAKLVGGVCALAIAAGAAVMLVTAAPVVWGVAKARKRIRNRRRS